MVFVACTKTNEAKPFENLTAEEIESVDLTLNPPQKTLNIDDRKKIEELVEILNTVVTYGEDTTEYAGQAVIFTLYKTDGSITSVNSYSPQIIIDDIKYTTDNKALDKLSVLGNQWHEESNEPKTFNEIKDILALAPSDSDKILNSSEYFVVSNGKVVAGKILYNNFIISVENHESAELIIVQFTTEGGPIYGYLYYNGESYYYVEDTSRDKFKGKYDDYIESEFENMIIDIDEDSNLVYTFLTNDKSVKTFWELIENDDVEYSILFALDNPSYEELPDIIKTPVENEEEIAEKETTSYKLEEKVSDKQ